jgi:hypothetical protein
LGEDSSAAKQRLRKEGSKPLGRPKKRNPDGTLVHPPKPPRQPKLDSQGKVTDEINTPLALFNEMLHLNYLERFLPLDTNQKAAPR